MAHKAFDSDELVKRMNSHGRPEHVAFGGACCERLIPNYKVFQHHARWGEAGHLHAALDAAWHSLPELAFEKQSIQLLLENVESITPDSEEFDSLFVASAQDACLSVCALLDYLVGGLSEKIVLIAQYCIDSIDLYVQETEKLDPSDPDLKKRFSLTR